MLTKTLTSEPVGEIKAVGIEASVARYAPRPRFAALASFFAIVAQFGLIVMVVDYWQLESLSLSRVMQLAFVGFVIHHLLPVRFRLPFFAGLSLMAVMTGVGHLGPNVIAVWMQGKSSLNGLLYHLVPGLTLIGIGLGLIGICHLPIRFGARVGLVAVAGAGLAFLRAHSQWFPDVTEMWVILG